MSDYQYKFSVGGHFIFTTPYEQYAKRIGERAVVVREVDRDTFDFEEVGAMFVGRFDDGVEIEVWPEEIDPSELDE